ncbi:MFS transporter [Rhodococcus sp. UNC23MFCrub1.1]|uniref:MFS transporter n=1 Tax=Rhodococcus sp. UNC23MFCrub1.1 TaxID=1449068 RepID=UPI0009E04F57|nr:MFS transporter [Rhodococcus sp. UNC23MFCrub1.1]
MPTYVKDIMNNTRTDGVKRTGENPVATSVTANRRRTLVSSAMGTTIEWYDFLLYGFLAPIVFNELFFPDFDPVVGTIIVFSTLAVGYGARPLGGLVFGHFGDKIGRKKIFMVTLVLMGVSTVGIGLLPTYDSIGIWAPILLVALRFCQGIGVGGETGAGTLLTLETAPDNRRGLYGSMVMATANVGVVLAVGSVALISLLPREDLLAWGWRVPFLGSIVLVAIGAYIRRNITESPAFERKRTEVKVPAVEVLKTAWRPTLAGIALAMIASTLYHLVATYALSIGPRNYELSVTGLTVATMIASLVALVTIPLSGRLSDSIGRKRNYYVAIPLAMVVVTVYFRYLLPSGNIYLVGLGMVVAIGVAQALMYGVEGALIAENYSTNVRFSGFSIAKQFGTLLGAGLSPLIASSLAAAFGGNTWAYVIFFGVEAVVAMVALVLLKETYRAPLRSVRQ